MGLAEVGATRKLIIALCETRRPQSVAWRGGDISRIIDGTVPWPAAPRIGSRVAGRAGDGWPRFTPWRPRTGPLCDRHDRSPPSAHEPVVAKPCGSAGSRTLDPRLWPLELMTHGAAGDSKRWITGGRPALLHCTAGQPQSAAASSAAADPEASRPIRWRRLFILLFPDLKISLSSPVRRRRV